MPLYCLPAALTRAPPPPTPLRSHPLPRLPRSGPSVAGSACAGVTAVPATRPGSVARCPSVFATREHPKVGVWVPAHQRTKAEDLGHPGSALQGGGPAGLGKDGAVGGGAGTAHHPRQSRLGPPGRPLMSCGLAVPPRRTGEGKGAVATPCPGRSE